jgi:hypothetical protein
LNSISANFSSVVFGLCSALATSLLLMVATRSTGYVLQSWSAWGVIPVGAMCAGAAASGGVYFTYRYLNRRPGLLVLAGAVGLAITTLVFTHWISYASLVVDGVHVAEHVSFPEYVRVVLTSAGSTTCVKVGAVRCTSSAVPLGEWGYALEALQVVGFATGGAAAYCFLIGAAYCESCSKYLVGAGESSRYFDDADWAERSYRLVAGTIRSGRPQAAIAEHLNSGTAQPAEPRVARATVALQRCPGCTRTELKYALWRAKRNSEWSEISKSVVRVATHGLRLAV